MTWTSEKLWKNYVKKKNFIRYVFSYLKLSVSPHWNSYAKKLELNEEHIFYLKTPLDLSFAGDIADICNDPSLKFDKLVPQKSESIAETMNIIPQIKRRDILLSYPYESIKPFIQPLNEAAKDPKVTDIKITLYRLAKNSQIIEALCDAAENGKKRTCFG